MHTSSNPDPLFLHAYAPQYWRVVLRLRAVPCDGGVARPVTAYYGDLESARRALEIVADKVGPAAVVYMVNAAQATDEEARTPWSRILWVAEQVDRAVAETAVTLIFRKARAPRYSFGAPRRFYDRLGGWATLPGGWILCRTMAWGYFRTQKEALDVRDLFLAAQREEQAMLSGEGSCLPG